MERIFLQLLHMSLTAAVLVLAVVLLRLAFRKAPRWLHCLLWVMVAVRLVCPFSIESDLSLMPSVSTVTVLDRPEPSAPVVPNRPSAEGIVPDAPSASLPSGGTSSAPVTPMLPDSSFAAPGDSVDPWQVALTVATYVWLLGMLAMAGYAVVSTLRLHRQVREAACLSDNIWQCDHIRTPFILGVFRPRIYLPSDIEGAARDSVVAHEKAHLQRLDHVWKPLGFLLLTVYWFNPALWVAYILLCRDIEAACDERVVRGMSAAERRTYSEALLACSAPRRLISACPLAFGETSVRARIKSVLSYKKPTVWLLVVALLVSAVAGVCLLTDRPAAESESGDPPSVSDGDDNPTADPESNELPSVSDGDDRPTGDGSVVSTGEPLYDALLKTMVDARQERPDCSAMVWQLAEWSDLGVRLLDVDQNGQKELLLSAVQWVEGVTPFAYDVYTIKDDKLVHLLSSVERGRYYLREDGYVEYQWAGGASVSGTDFYRLVDGSLTFVERVTYDADYAVEIGLADGLSSVTEGFWFCTTHIPDGSKEGYVSITPQQAKDRIAAITSAHPLLNVAYSPAMSGSTTTTSPANTTTKPTTTTSPTNTTTTVKPTTTASPTTPAVKTATVGDIHIAGGMGTWREEILKEVYPDYIVSYPLQSHPIKVLYTYEELTDFLARYAADDRYLKQEDFARFNAAWFVENALLMTYYQDGTYSVHPQIGAYTYSADGTILSVGIDVHTPPMGDDALGVWHMFSGIKKVDLKGVTKVTAYVRARIPESNYIAVFTEPTRHPQNAVEKWRTWTPYEESRHFSRLIKADLFEDVTRACQYIAVINQGGHDYYISDDFAAIQRDDGKWYWMTDYDAESIRKLIAAADEYRILYEQ